METLQSTIFIEFDVNTKKITFLRGDNIIDYDSDVTSVYVRVKYKNLSGNTVYLTPSELEDYKFSLYTMKPLTKNVTEITGEVTDELKENVYGGVVKFEIPRVCTNRLGIVKCEIHINQGNKIIGSSTFVLDVKQSLVTTFDDELLGDEDFPVLKQLILEIQKDSNIDDNNRSKITSYSSDKVENIKEDLNSQIKENSYNIDNIKTIIEGINCSPKSVYATLNDLKSAFPNGDNNIYVVSEDGGWYYWKETDWLRGGDYQSNIISDESIGLRHVNFIENINYFNKSNILINGYYNHETFKWNDLEGVSQTEDIHCEPGDTIYFTARSNSDTYKAVFKNNNKDIIKGVFIDNTTAHDNLTFCFKVPSGVNYFTLMFYNNQIDTFMITINKPCPLLYRPYVGLKNLSSDIHIDGDNITLKTIEKKHVNYNTVEDYITDYKDGSVNIFNKNKMLVNSFWSAETLQFIKEKGVHFSNFIKCKETDVIRIKVNNIGSNYHVVFKNKEGQIFDSIFYENYPNEIITIRDIPKDACYFGVNLYKVDIERMMITINNEIPSTYQEYKASKLELSDNLISVIKSIYDRAIKDYIVDYKDNSVNVFNTNNMLRDSLWDAETLQFIKDKGVHFSNFIKCEESDVIRIKINNIGSNYHVVFKNKKGEIFDGIFYEKYPNEIITIRDIPKDTWSFGVNLYEADVNSMMITINNEVPSSYQQYKPSKLELNDSLISAIKSAYDRTIEDYIIDYKDNSINVFNTNNMVANGFWSAETLQFIYYKGINFSNFIKCKETDVIRIKVNNIGGNYHVVFKNKEGQIFDSIFYEKYPNEIITIRDIPKGSWYFGVNVYEVDLNAMMITINNEMPSLYEEYKPSKLELSNDLISAIKSSYDSNDNNSNDAYLDNRLLVWEEDFDGNEIDRTSWINLCRKDGSGNNQLEYNTARSKNCRIVNNQLIIEAKREHYKGKEWTSANLNTSNLHEFQYGRIEAKIKLPNSHGIWPAFWMMGANADLSTDKNDEFVYTGVDWPTCGEIDIFEYWGRNSCGKLGGALHCATDTNNTLGSKEFYEVLEGQNNYDPTQWHIYGIEWTEDKIDFLVDNEVKGTASLEQYTLSNGYNPFRLPHYLILNVAVDIADNTTDKNNLMFVDWVRVYAPENVESYVNPTGITLNTNTVTLNVGDERVPSLQANILPIDASEKTVIWESSDSDIVVVGGGALTAKKQGTCEIIARTLNGYEARCTVTVN